MSRRIDVRRDFFAALLLALWCNVTSANNFQDLEEIRHAAREFAQREVGASDQNVEISVGRLDPRLRLSACRLPLQTYFSPGSRTIGHTNVGVRCDDAKAWSLFVPLHIDRQIAVAVAAQGVDRGTVLSAADIRYERRSVATLNGQHIPKADDLIGKQATRAIHSGAAITQNMLRNRRLVRRGERVVLAIKSGSVAVRVAGTALRDGSIGERVPVRNLSSKRVIEGTVHGAGVVLVGAPRAKL